MVELEARPGRGRLYCLRTKRTFALLSGLCALGGNPAAAIDFDQFDDFQDGTTQDWIINVSGFGFPPPQVLPANVPNAGPVGVGDNALRLTAIGGLAAGSRLAVNNITADWTGDYSAAEVVGLKIDANNPNAFPLTLRVGVDDLVLGGGGKFVTDGQVLPALSGWTTLQFPIEAVDLTAAKDQFGVVVGTDPVLTLSQVAKLKSLHSTEANWPGDTIVAGLDLDNIQAVPEPGSTLMQVAAGGGLLVLAGRRARNGA